jgi:hypothetical protein
MENKHKNMEKKHKNKKRAPPLSTFIEQLTKEVWSESLPSSSPLPL